MVAWFGLAHNNTKTNQIYMPTISGGKRYIMSKMTMEQIKTGKMQLNVKSAKDFRATLAKWHNADFELAEELLRKNDRVKA